MSGHSKWSTIKHKKAVNDAVKGSVFTKMAKAITIAVKLGGGVGSPETNFSLRLAMDRARSVNMPKEKIDRAIERGMHKGEGEELAELLIEAFGPDQVLVLIEAVSDNRNRTVAELRVLIEKNGGVMGSQGSVAHMFERVGIVTTRAKLDEEAELELIDYGVIDVVDQEGELTIYTNPESLHRVIEHLDREGIVAEGSLGYRPKATVEVADSSRIESFLSAVSQYDDVQGVYANWG